MNIAIDVPQENNEKKKSILFQLNQMFVTVMNKAHLLVCVDANLFQPYNMTWNIKVKKTGSSWVNH